MNPLTDSDYELIFESLSYTREKFANYSGYPDEDFRRAQIGRVDTAIEHLLELQQGSSSQVLAAPGTAAVSSAPGAQGVRTAGNAVGEVAQKGSGPARNGVARAARLLADAEHIANSITDETPKAWALSAVAATLAATDPDRAEHIANSITDETPKAWALSAVAAALAATDPDRAEHIANSITDETAKASALAAVAAALAARSS